MTKLSELTPDDWYGLLHQTERGSADVFPWTQSEAIEMCCVIRKFAPSYGFHVGLTGGCLYKLGPRKDADILIYRIRQEDGNFDALLLEMVAHGFEIIKKYGFVTKATYKGKPVDILFPEAKEKSSYYGANSASV